MSPPPVSLSRPCLALHFSKEVLFFIKSSRAKRRSLLILEIEFPMLFYVCSRPIRDRKWSVQIKWITLGLPLVHEDDDYDDYVTPNGSRIDEASFTPPDTTEATSTLQLTQKKKKRDKLAALYRHLNVTGNLDLINLNRFKLTTDPKKGATTFEFYNGDRWVSLTKQSDEVFAPKTLRDRFGGINAIKIFLGNNTSLARKID